MLEVYLSKCQNIKVQSINSNISRGFHFLFFFSSPLNANERLQIEIMEKYNGKMSDEMITKILFGRVVSIDGRSFDKCYGRPFYIQSQHCVSLLHYIRER